LKIIVALPSRGSFVERLFPVIRRGGLVRAMHTDRMSERDRHWSNRGSGGGGAVYFFGFIGALVFYIRQADGFWGGVLGVLKAFVWPAFLVYDALKHLAG
jgi:hypothetical protein